MAAAKLRMRDIRRHPATLKSPTELEVGLEVVRCHFITPAGRRERAAQAMFALTQKKPDTNLREALRAGYRHTPSWGIVIDQVARVKNFRENALGVRFIGLDVTQTSSDVPLQEVLERHTAHSVDEVAGLLEGIPTWDGCGWEGEALASYEAIMDYESLGLARDPLQMNPILFDRSKL